MVTVLWKKPFRNACVLADWDGEVGAEQIDETASRGDIPHWKDTVVQAPLRLSNNRAFMEQGALGTAVC